MYIEFKLLSMLGVFLESIFTGLSPVFILYESLSEGAFVVAGLVVAMILSVDPCFVSALSSADRPTSSFAHSYPKITQYIVDLCQVRQTYKLALYL